MPSQRGGVKRAPSGADSAASKKAKSAAKGSGVNTLMRLWRPLVEPRPDDVAELHAAAAEREAPSEAPEPRGSRPEDAPEPSTTASPRSRQPSEASQDTVGNSDEEVGEGGDEEDYDPSSRGKVRNGQPGGTWASPVTERTSTGPKGEFELQRERRIAANKAKLAALGLAGGPILPTGQDSGVPQLSRPKARPKKRHAAPPVPQRATRGSARLRGFDADGVTPSQTAPTIVPAAASASEPEPGTSRRGLKMEDPRKMAPVVAPFSLRSIGVTVESVGSIHRGAFASRYWSSQQCLYYHAYPVGYRARKAHFGRTFEMTISEGRDGPVFTVTDVESGAAWSGPSATKPWTAICVARRSGVRISGPLFFGFSDPITLRAIAALYTEEELRACLAGEKVGTAPATAEEAVARQLQAEVPGVGEATAIALAHTAALPRPVDSLGALRAVARADQGEALRAWLLESDEVAEKTRRWPAWRARMVPKMVAWLLAEGEDEAAAVGAGAEGAAGGAGAGKPSRAGG